MSKDSAIEWTDHTFNPWWGCAKLSPACAHCYAETGSKRYGFDVWGEHKPRRFFSAEHWTEPHKWNHQAAKAGKPAFVFTASYADVCELLPADHPQRDEMERTRFRLRETIRATPWLTWLLLTKRPENFPLLIPGNWPPNAWAGTTAEDQTEADRRLPELTRIPVQPSLCGTCQCVPKYWQIIGHAQPGASAYTQLFLSQILRRDLRTFENDLEHSCQWGASFDLFPTTGQHQVGSVILVAGSGQGPWFINMFGQTDTARGVDDIEVYSQVAFGFGDHRPFRCLSPNTLYHTGDGSGNFDGMPDSVIVQPFWP